MKILALLFAVIFVCAQGKCQAPDAEMDSLLWQEISALVYLDSVTISPIDIDIDVDSFVMIMLQDESFYDAFINLRLYGHKMKHDIHFKNKKGAEIDHYMGIHRQEMDDLCRVMQIESSDHSNGYFNRKGEYEYITSKIIDRVFYTHGMPCADTNRVKVVPDSKFEQNIDNLKTVIFKPGRDVEVPLIGDKMSIFSKKMRKYYDYTVDHIPYNDNFSYIFEVEIKPEYKNNNNKTVIRKMTTYFDEENFKVQAREYYLRYKTGIYSFDIKIDVSLTKWNNIYLPNEVVYDGYWKIIGRKAERCNFNFILSEYN